jgi:CDP-diglyceride synthetase
MTNWIRRLLIVAVGLLGALFAWPLIELFVARQDSFPSYFIYSLVSGIAVGASMGAFFGSAEGLLGASPRKALAGALQGIAVGLVGGVLGSLVAQALLFVSGESLLQSSSPRLGAAFVLARAAGWAVVGCAIGTSEGIRARSPKKALLGAAGGAAGGFLGGLLFVWLGTAMPSFYLGRLLALLVMGALIGIFYALLEKRFAAGTFKALNGPLKGKEYLVNQRRISIGSSESRDIVLKGYRDIASAHAVVKVERGGKIVIEKKDGKVVVNDKEVDRAELELDDVIKIGSAKFLYGYFG